MSVLRRRLDRLERRLPLPPPTRPGEELRQRRWEAVAERWLRLAEGALALLDAAEQQRVEEAAARLGEECGPYADWLRNLRQGWCRLPELPPEAMTGLLLAWLHPQAEGGIVCQGCGLEYPRHKAPPLSEWKLLPGRVPQQGPPPWYDLPRLFPACPGCGAPPHEADWPHQTQDFDRPWKGLDGCV